MWISYAYFATFIWLGWNNFTLKITFKEDDKSNYNKYIFQQVSQSYNQALHENIKSADIDMTNKTITSNLWRHFSYDHCLQFSFIHGLSSFLCHNQNHCVLTIRLLVSGSYKKNSWAPVGHYCMDNHDNIFGRNVKFFDRKKIAEKWHFTGVLYRR